MAVHRSKKTEKSPLSPEAVLAGSALAPAPKPVKEPKAAKAPKAARPGKAPAVLLDYPQQGETVRAGHYAIRVAAKDGLKVEVSIDGGVWTECRNAAGYYWYDWTPAAPGQHQIVARAVNGGPRPRLSEERVVVVASDSI